MLYASPTRPTLYSRRITNLHTCQEGLASYETPDYLRRDRDLAMYSRRTPPRFLPYMFGDDAVPSAALRSRFPDVHK